MSRNITEIIAGLHLNGNHMEGDALRKTLLEIGDKIPYEIDDKIAKAQDLGDIPLLNLEQIARAVRFIPRGIGSNSIPCFHCGKLEKGAIQPDMASFVNNKYDGEKAVAMFTSIGSNAVLDYRDYEPSYIQVKVGACKPHVRQLERLQLLVNTNGRNIHPLLIEAATTEIV